MSEELAIESLREPMSIGKVFAESGLFPDIKSQSQAVVKILAGKELGLSPFQSMKDIYIVGGKLALQANALASLIKTSKKYDYKVEVLTETECKIIFLRVDKEKVEQIGLSEFTFKDAAKAGLVNKDNWKNYPRNCLFARALSNGVRWYCPDAACGFYVEEEIESLYNNDQKQTITITKDGDVTNGETKAAV